MHSYTRIIPPTWRIMDICTPKCVQTRKHIQPQKPGKKDSRLSMPEPILTGSSLHAPAGGSGSIIGTSATNPQLALPRSILKNSSMPTVPIWREVERDRERDRRAQHIPFYLKCSFTGVTHLSFYVTSGYTHTPTTSQNYPWLKP